VWPANIGAHQIYKGIVNVLNCLFQMSMAIGRPAQHDQFVGSRIADSAFFKFHNRQHVWNKYPKADKNIIDRLRVAASRRRVNPKYRERHHIMLGKGIINCQKGQPETASTILSDTLLPLESTRSNISSLTRRYPSQEYPRLPMLRLY
jgi:hypothetical protein